MYLIDLIVAAAMSTNDVFVVSFFYIFILIRYDSLFDITELECTDKSDRCLPITYIHIMHKYICFFI